MPAITSSTIWSRSYRPRNCQIQAASNGDRACAMYTGEHQRALEGAVSGAAEELRRGGRLDDGLDAHTRAERDRRTRRPVATGPKSDQDDHATTGNNVPINPATVGR